MVMCGAAAHAEALASESKLGAFESERVGLVLSVTRPLLVAGAVCNAGQ